MKTLRALVLGLALAVVAGCSSIPKPNGYAGIAYIPSRFNEGQTSTDQVKFDIGLEQRIMLGKYLELYSGFGITTIVYPLSISSSSPDTVQFNTSGGLRVKNVLDGLVDFYFFHYCLHGTDKMQKAVTDNLGHVYQIGDEALTEIGVKFTF